jgi:hypothetical protein
MLLAYLWLPVYKDLMHEYCHFKTSALRVMFKDVLGNRKAITFSSIAHRLIQMFVEY